MERERVSERRRERSFEGDWQGLKGTSRMEIRARKKAEAGRELPGFL